MKFAQKLELAVRQDGRSISQITKKIGLSRAYLYNIFKSKSLPSFDRLRDILDALDIDEPMGQELLRLRDAEVDGRNQERNFLQKATNSPPNSKCAVFHNRLMESFRECELEAKADSSKFDFEFEFKFSEIKYLRGWVFVSLRNHAEALGQATIMYERDQNLRFVVPFLLEQDRRYEELFNNVNTAIINPTDLIYEINRKKEEDLQLHEQIEDHLRTDTQDQVQETVES